MRVLLRRRTNGFYYQGDGKWISNPAKGLNFGSIHEAVEYGDQSGPHEVELILAFEGSKRFSAVSLVDSSHARFLRRCRFSPPAPKRTREQGLVE
jgi:hypothetical protein